MSSVITQDEANSEMDKEMQPTSAIPAIHQKAMEDITTIGTGESREKKKEILLSISIITFMFIMLFRQHHENMLIT